MNFPKTLNIILVFSFILSANIFISAQGRILINADFEQPQLANPNTWGLVHHSAVPGWSTTSSSGQIEFWRAPFQGVMPPSGQQHIELNANQPADLYFEACMFDGETVNWSFYHRGRAGRDSARLLIGPAGAEVEVLRFGTNNNAWVQYTGSFTNNHGNTSIRFRFQPISTATGNLTVGNFIDNVEITGLPPVIEFAEEQYSDLEANGGNIPRIRVNGRIPNGGMRVDLEITGGDASLGQDFTITTPFVIPAGDYDGSTTIDISSALQIIDDTVYETDESFSIRLNNPQNPMLIHDTDCDGLVFDEATYTILDDDFVLAVELSAFEAENVDCNYNLIRWSSETEEAHDYYELEYSFDALEWNSLSQINGNAAEGEGSDYQFKHYNSHQEIYYRLKIVDLYAEYVYSDVLYLNTPCKASTNFQVYPNPIAANSSLQIRLSDYQGPLRIQIINMNGQVVQQEEIEYQGTENQFQITQLPAAVYQIQLIGEGIQKSQRIVVY
jgi:hypothetical protein